MNTHETQLAALLSYYNARAAEFERIYHRDDATAQAELAEIRSALRTAVTARTVLEVACGTGYWTEVIADVADGTVATDLSPDMLEIAQKKEWPTERVRFQIADAYDLGGVEGVFTAGVAAFWLSHVPRRRLVQFLDQLHARLLPESVMFLADNVYVPGLGGDLIVDPEIQDTFKSRSLEDGSTHVVLKNYFSQAELEWFLVGHRDIAVTIGQRFWWASYRTRTT
jgi:SAM-dependent methyltransferase